MKVILNETVESLGQEGDIVLVGASCRKYFFSSSSGQLPFYNDTLIKINTNIIENLNIYSFKKLIYRFQLML